MKTTDLLDALAKPRDSEFEAAARVGELMYHASESPHEEIQALAEHWNNYENNRYGYWTRRWRTLLETAWEKDEDRQDPEGAAMRGEEHPSLTAEERNPGLATS